MPNRHNKERFMSFRKVISAIAAACVLTGSLALGTADASAAPAKPHAHKEIVCKPGLVAHQVKVGDKLVWKCGKVHHAKKAATKKATVKAKPAAKHKTHPKKTNKLVCKKGSAAKKVKKHGKWVWECFKVKPAKK
jgi:predicted RecA/RadA family phage recombinase